MQLSLVSENSPPPPTSLIPLPLSPTTLQSSLDNAVVIGGSGYLGKRLVRQLVEDGNYKVHSLDLSIPPPSRRNPDVSSYIQTDITNREDMIKALRGMDVVFHTASIIPLTIDVTDKDMYRVNISGAQNVIEACKLNDVQRLVYTSSSSVVLSKNRNKVSENVEESQSLPDDPLNMYVKTKGMAETMVTSTNGIGGLQTCVLRLAGLIGGADNRLMQNLMSACVVQFGSGRSRISWIGVESAANAHIVADKRLRKSPSEVAGRVYNISLADKFNVAELFQSFAEENGRPLVALPMWVVKVLVNINMYVYNKTSIILIDAYFTPAGLEFLQRHFTVSTERAQKELGWAESRPWREVVKELIKEYKAESRSQEKLCNHNA